MTINKVESISYFDTNSGVQESNNEYRTRSPAFQCDPGTYCYKTWTSMSNRVLKMWVNMTDTTATSFKIMLGVDNTGVGRALQFDFSAANKWVRLVNVSGFDVAYDTVIEEIDLHTRWTWVNDIYEKLQIEIQGAKIRVSYGRITLFERNDMTYVGNHWGFCNLTASSTVYASDVDDIENQIIYGNVNLNGAPDDDGVVLVYNQQSYELYKKTRCDANGEYFVFIDDDPQNVNKYFIYGYIDGSGTVQPRGVSNITIV